ncbi:MAG: trypsin-like peptidase domain-containing protein [Rhodocyclaceae bacterium]|nr:trypsin-like peptidase domain-containing protein [Rhodocyclaceae bacterium]
MIWCSGGSASPAFEPSAGRPTRQSALRLPSTVTMTPLRASLPLLTLALAGALALPGAEVLAGAVGAPGTAVRPAASTPAQGSAKLPPAQGADTPAPRELQQGTGFVVSREGHVVTAFHVIKGKSEVMVGPMPNGRWKKAAVLRTDETLDLALLRIDLQVDPLPVSDWADVPMGLEALVVGYPLPKVQGLSRKVTQGIVNGDRKTGGVLGDFQLSAEVQKGNSGGPVLAPDGTVIGVVRAKLNALSVAEKTRDLPQNVNYALKSTPLIGFLKDAGVTFEQRVPDLATVYRPYQTFRRVEKAVFAVVARDPREPVGLEAPIAAEPAERAAPASNAPASSAPATGGTRP